MCESVKITMNKFVDCYFFGFTSGLKCERIVIENPDITIGAISLEVFGAWFRGTLIASTFCMRQIRFNNIGVDRTIYAAVLRPCPTVFIFTKCRHICPKDIKVGT
jgi:hypothetical protein